MKKCCEDSQHRGQQRLRRRNDERGCREDGGKQEPTPRDQCHQHTGDVLGGPSELSQYPDDGRQEDKPVGEVVDAVLGLGEDDPLLSALKEWRSRTAKDIDKPAYVIFHDSTLEEIVEREPESLDDLLLVPGIGPTKAERYGEAVLEIIGGHRT